MTPGKAMVAVAVLLRLAGRDPVAAAELRKLPLSEESGASHERLALGVNYTGAQVRLGLSARWAVESRFQRGKATSNYGDVTAQVFGLRTYRFSRPASRWPLYLGGEIAYATAKPETSSYKTAGMAGGFFGGVEYRVTRWLSVNADLGPYVISLTEKQTHTGSTNLDFVLNTALLVRIF